jgi:hypothetical protein
VDHSALIRGDGLDFAFLDSPIAIDDLKVSRLKVRGDSCLAKCANLSVSTFSYLCTSHEGRVDMKASSASSELLSLWVN